MKTVIPFRGLSQYAKDIDSKKQGSACGPVTAAAILSHYERVDHGINELYNILGTTPIGLFTWRLLKNLRRLAGQRYAIKRARTLDEVKSELLAGRPLAMKFDRWFSFRWFSQPTYNYHWVPLIGFEEKPDDLVLYIHDNGQKNRPSKVRAVSYNKNRTVLTFIKIIPIQKG
ncbi:peptidase C39-like protein [Planomicrobium soli]|uniref:Peptidase C39-like protein n=1 Tax=Planomicrobium soli TaxID=1176648 RepID=A0A2P8GG39_9BACL|nr:C39 family peptidase [Planomicrobium soli]PSL32956.1 peptidase C39-like protein [Planomicrobium soli]